MERVEIRDVSFPHPRLYTPFLVGYRGFWGCLRLFARFAQVPYLGARQMSTALFKLLLTAQPPAAGSWSSARQMLSWQTTLSISCLQEEYLIEAQITTRGWWEITKIKGPE